MKVMLVNPNRIVTPVTPIGLAYIYSAIKEQHDTIILDLMFESDPEKALTNSINSFQPDVIGISIRNIDNATYVAPEFYIPFISKLIEVCRQTSETIKIVLGGAGFSIMPLEIMEKTQADYGVIGEGENSFSKLLEYIDSNNQKRIQEIPSIVYRDEYVYSMTRKTGDFILPDIPTPDRSLLDNKKYLKYGGMGNVQTKRGCNLHCSYCVYPLIEGRKYRLRNPVEVANEIIELYDDYGIDYIHFCDSTFNLPHEHAIQISQELIKRGSKVRWTPYVTPHPTLDERAIETFLQAGCDGFHLGVDSLANPILSNLKKEFTYNEVKRICNICNKYNLPFAFNMIFGTPGETIDTLNESVNKIFELKPAAVFVMPGVRVYPGTHISRSNDVRKEINNDNLLNPTFYISPRIQPERMIEILTEKAEKYKNWFMPSKEKKGVHANEKLMNIYQKGIRGPIWKVLDCQSKT